MNSLTDIKIIECNRQASNEVFADSVENTSSWRNNLTDVIHLEAGDKVSVYSSFISVDGAGQSNTMDIKGKSLGVKITLPKIDIDSTKITDTSNPNYNIMETIKETASQGTDIFEVRDNELNIVVSYYKNMDLDGYVQLPRRFVKNYDWASTGTQEGRNGWSIPGFDSHTEGRCLTNQWSCYMDSDYKYYKMSNSTQANNCLKLRNDGSRYTLMIRNVSHMQQASGQNNLPGFPFRHGGSEFSKDPENALYFQYKEIKNLIIPKGFNSANYVAEELTRQLQEIKKDTTFTYQKEETHDELYKVYEDFTTTKILESNTYKAFNCGSINNYQEEEFTASFGTPTGTEPERQKQVAFYQNYQYILMKRPDFYQIGQRLNTIKGRELKRIIPQYGTHIFSTDGLYNETNLKLLKDFFEVQAKYPEFWAENNLKTCETQGSHYVGSGIGSHNSRFFHMNRRQPFYYCTPNKPSRPDIDLGFSYYEQTVKPSEDPDGGDPHPFDTDKDQLASQAVFTFYDPSQKDTYYDNPNVDRGELTYGFASKDATYGTIVLHPNLLKKPDGTVIGLPISIFQTGSEITAERKWGFDYHWGAYGNATIMLWNGRSELSAGSDIDRSMRFRQTTTNRPSSPTPLDEPQVESILNPKINVKSYLGSDASQVGYDGTHFFFTNFHTPKNVGTTSGAGSDLVQAADGANPHVNLEGFTTNAQNVVYKMNVKDDFVQYSPVRIPYEPKRKIQQSAATTDPEAPAVFYLYQQPNINQDYYSVFDSICGLSIEDFGIDEEQWEDSLWGLMGFTYEQFHSVNNVRTERIGTNNINNLNIMTTNAEIPIGDSKVFNQNSFGQSTYNNQLTQPLAYHTIGASGGDNDKLYLLYPSIQQNAISIKVIAQDFPVSMARGYYSIRSDIISDSHFIGGRKENTIMPIVAVVDKMNPQGDFYFGTESSIQFTMTGNRILSSVSVSLHDPDGSIANVGDYSSVLFKIEKQQKLTYNIAQEIVLQEKQSKEKK